MEDFVQALFYCYMPLLKKNTLWDNVVHSDYGKDARVLVDGSMYTVVVLFLKKHHLAVKTTQCSTVYSWDVAAKCWKNNACNRQIFDKISTNNENML